MATKIKKALLLAVFSLIGPLSLVSGVSMAATNCSSSDLTAQQAVQCGTDSASGSPQTPAQAASNINSTVTTVVNVLSIVAGTAAVIMIIIGGIRYITSGGEQNAVASAKNSVLYATIGLVIVALAQIIVHFVLQKTTKATS